MNRNTIITFFLTALIPGAVACSHNEPEIEDGALAMDFGISLGQSAESESFGGSPALTDCKSLPADETVKAGGGQQWYGHSVTTNEMMQTASFGIYGGYSLEKGGAALTNVFDGSNAEEVSWNAAEAKWQYDPVKFWRRNQHYRFRAFHPYDALQLEAASDADGLVIEYRIAEHRYDLLTASAHRHPASYTERYDPVKLNFKHALSALRFKVAYNDDPSIDPDNKDKVTKFFITGLSPAGTMFYKGYTDSDPNTPLPTEQWEWVTIDNVFDRTTPFYYREWAESERKEFVVYKKESDGTDNAVNIFDETPLDDSDDGLLYVVPQICSKANLGDTIIHIFTEEGKDADHTVALPSIEWKPNKIYTYTLKISVSDVKLIVSIKDWIPLQSNNDIHL